MRTTRFGGDYARGPVTVGLSVGRIGLGDYACASAGQMTTSMTGLYLPLARLPAQRQRSGA